MNIQEIISTERTWACENLQAPDPVLFMLDRIEAAVCERIKLVEASVAGYVVKEVGARAEGYERLLDKAYDDFYAAVDNRELREILKELIEYAPRKNWEEK